MGRKVDADKFIMHYNNLADRAKAEGKTDVEMQFRMATVLMAQYLQVFGEDK